VRVVGTDIENAGPGRRELREDPEMVTPFVVGVVLTVGVAVFARSVSLDRDRAFYPTLMIVIALYY
jgi:hypothetical protein